MALDVRCLSTSGTSPQVQLERAEAVKAGEYRLQLDGNLSCLSPLLFIAKMDIWGLVESSSSCRSSGTQHPGWQHLKG
eukprot:3418765-Amphidinium_carterae.2